MGPRRAGRVWSQDLGPGHGSMYSVAWDPWRGNVRLPSKAAQEPGGLTTLPVPDRPEESPPGFRPCCAVGNCVFQAPFRTGLIRTKTGLTGSPAADRSLAPATCTRWCPEPPSDGLRGGECCGTRQLIAVAVNKLRKSEIKHLHEAVASHH